MYLWLKALHIIAIVAWFAGIFYLPRLFVYHCTIPDTEINGINRFRTMERRLFWGIMTPSGIFSLLLGFGLIHAMKLSFQSLPTWLLYKLFLVGLVVAYHLYCGFLVAQFKQGRTRHSALYYRVFNEISVVLLVGIVLLVVLKPF